MLSLFSVSSVTSKERRIVWTVDSQTSVGRSGIEERSNRRWFLEDSLCGRGIKDSLIDKPKPGESDARYCFQDWMNVSMSILSPNSGDGSHHEGSQLVSLEAMASIIAEYMDSTYEIDGCGMGCVTESTETALETRLSEDQSPHRIR